MTTATDITVYKDPAIELASAGGNFTTIAKQLGIDVKTLYNIRRQDPTFADMLEKAMFEGSTIVVEKIQNVPYDEPNPALARVKLEALSKYLELRWPHRYGKRLDVTVRTLDMRSALDNARNRVSKVSQVIDMQPDSDGVYTDSQSVDTQNQAGQAVNAAVLVSTIDDLL